HHKFPILESQSFDNIERLKSGRPSLRIFVIVGFIWGSAMKMKMGLNLFTNRRSESLDLLFPIPLMFQKITLIETFFCCWTWC
ncbi:hypothetical protein GIB67_013120, partial [Kingdonia uniflora]